MKLPTAEQMRSLDAAAVQRFGIPSIVLMENAGRGTVEAICSRLGDPAGKVVSIFVGPGNNGGDGLVIARHLHQRRARPQVFLLVPAESLGGDAAINLGIVQKLPIPVHPLESEGDLAVVEERLHDSWAVVDAVFGTGLSREVGGHFAAVIRRINRFACPVVAVDIPSGLETDSGEPLGFCVQATLTVTFGLAKPGLVFQPGARYVGELVMVDIGIPPQAVEQAAIQMELLEDDIVGRFLPHRHSHAHKGTFGHLLVVAGSTGKTGAAMLCGRGALRSGAGLVTLCVPNDLNQIFETALPEAMTVPLTAQKPGTITDVDHELIAEAIAGKQAMVVGPGLGTAPATGDLVARLYRESRLPMVIDADGLNLLAPMQTALANPPAPRILTPHPGEMARLAGKSTAEVQADRLGVAADFAKSHNVFLVLKGAGTVIAAPDGELAVNPTGNPGMAAGGMGDVLSGFIGGLLAQGLSPWQAACLAVYVHGRAGDRLRDAAGIELGFLATELADELPFTLEEIVASAG